MKKVYSKKNVEIDLGFDGTLDVFKGKSLCHLKRRLDDMTDSFSLSREEAALLIEELQDFVNS